MIGHKITEGFERSKCFFAEEARWKIKSGSVSNFKIEKVVESSSTSYVIVASMRYRTHYTVFNSRVKIAYRYVKGWKLEFVSSLGMRIIPSHRYEDCISCEIKDDGWGGVNALFVSNTIGVNLLVGGYLYFSDGKRLPFNVYLPAYQTQQQVGGTFSGGSVRSFKIIFVERADSSDDFFSK